MLVVYKDDGGSMEYTVSFACTYKYDYLEAQNHLPTDYVRPSEVAQATFVGKTKNDCCDGTYQRSKDKHNDRFMWDKVTTTQDEADKRFIYWDNINNKWCIAQGSSDQRQKFVSSVGSSIGHSELMCSAGLTTGYNSNYWYQSNWEQAST
jgi:hypothetical protein